MINIKYADGMFQMCEGEKVVDTFDTVGVLFNYEDSVLLKWGDYSKVNAYAETYRNCMPAGLQKITLFMLSAKNENCTDEMCQKLCEALNHSICCSGSVANQFSKFCNKYQDISKE